MSFVRLLPENDTDDEIDSLSDVGIIIKNVTPRSTADPNDFLCTCSCCPNLSDWCIKDAFGLTCAIMTWIFFFYGEFVIVFVILTPASHSLLYCFTNLILFHIVEFLAISSHLRTMFSNPGTVPLRDATREHLLRYEHGTTVYRCTMCKSIKPPRSHHCSVCQRCIKRMDHHCVFVNNCVGQNNQKFFILFTFYTFILSVYGLILLLTHITQCISSNWVECPKWSPIPTLIFVITGSLEGLSFSVFTITMTSIQLYSIYTDTTQIELLKGETLGARERPSFINSLKTVFGSQVGLTWLNPFSTPVYLRTQNHERITFDI